MIIPSPVPGFVYALLNPTFPKLIKIGKTGSGAEVRAKQLRGTGVPKAFIVLWQEYVSDMKAVEDALHKRFADYREEDDREFFNIPAQEAIRVLMEEAKPYSSKPSGDIRRVSILDDLKNRYTDYMRDGIVSAAIVQTKDVCFLETHYRQSEHYQDEIIERIDLSVVAGAFSSCDSVEHNVTQFLELDEFSLANVTNIFSVNAVKKIFDEHEKSMLEDYERRRQKI